MKRTTMILTAAMLIAPAAFAARVDRRQENQQDRIAQGINSGSLNAAEAAKLEKEEAKFQYEKHDMRVDNGGYLTQKQKVKLNNQQNRMSRQIYRLKHN